MLEVETYRRQAEAVVGRTIVGVDAPDAWYVKNVDPAELVAALTGCRIEAARRIGKLLVLDLDDGSRLGLRFGMTGRLLVDGSASIDKLEYSSARDEPAWERFTLHFDDGGDLRMRDPRRLGGVALDPDESVLGPDAQTLTVPALQAALGKSTAPLKARLLDQARIAGIGNLLADEILWRAGLDPARPAGGLSPDELDALAGAIADTLDELAARGGSHTGDLRAGVATGAVCPLDGTPLVRRTIGGRTSWSCPKHQV
ncbi:MAG TPA: DNA-formamidopyrimidine glycosylase family protein [Acidimicrobiales bacterium]|nr:DNA-formamidopyrimidine glycosylase family protein [Acidimicrobiales bacterium]